MALVKLTSPATVTKDITDIHATLAIHYFAHQVVHGLRGHDVSTPDTDGGK
jgi:hypothetical protein